jgi:hypothetical protein
MRNQWIGLTWDAWALGIEASSVIGLRMLKLSAGGPIAAAESQRMVAEKLKAATELQSMAATGALGYTPASAARKTMSHYRKKVRANQRRLSNTSRGKG